MARTLSMTYKVMSLKGRIEIKDEEGDIVYVCERGNAAFAPTVWLLYRGEEEIGSVRRKAFSWSRTWLVSGIAGDFACRQKVFSSVNHLDITGKAMTDAVVTGNLLGTRFAVMQAEKVLARAQAHCMTLRQRITINILDGSELFVVFAMVVLQLIRLEHASSLAASSANR